MEATKSTKLHGHISYFELDGYHFHFVSV